ncbi:MULTISPECIES: hypothetical protein [Bacillus]|jgi:hypothetical protein|uniref:hypothetical protein n=1 Tax=Bacillus TaxID=1386 RepID=UPI00085820DE|nr:MULTISPECIES: hypothetical protein [Bacillus]AZJ20970.1 hypothetical protein CT694_15335 [Bacillus wiedmannii bv. thuringiensis]MCU5330532.1 hypothetical protein [Bacillus wiedmannii]OWT51025.1 hypothetical protein CER22_12380 [Bacillus sp. K2I17]PEL93888.1 hypothetical protein CN626_04425 [Bacillus wiedmannii]PRT22529.1 hypothetical protein C6360_13495 [Bacillus wiedmannii]
MIDVIRLVIFIVVAIGAIFNIYLEFKKPKKSIYSIVFLSVLFIGASGLIKDILSKLL